MQTERTYHEEIRIIRYYVRYQISRDEAWSQRMLNLIRASN